MNNKVKVKHEKDTSNLIFTFPKTWGYKRCKIYCEKMSYNPFILRMRSNGGNQFVCAYSWRLHHFNLFGEYPEK